MLSDCIEREKKGTDYVCPPEDKSTLLEMLGKINVECGTHIEYLAELDAFYVIGAGNIVVDYIDRFSSESVKAYLIPQILLDRIKDCDRLILRLYRNFRDSSEYISAPGIPAPSHIYTRYDAAFHKLKSKRIKMELLNIVSFPRDAFYLPLTVKMLASWKIPELKRILLNYLNPCVVTMLDVGLCEDGQAYSPPFSYIRRELTFTAINCLGYYPSQETADALFTYASDPDKDIRLSANRIYKQISNLTGSTD